jgi:putative ABC transport system permease protein
MESLLVNGVALVLAIGVMRVSVGGFNQLTGKNIPFQLWKDSTFWVPIVLVFLSDQHFGSVFGFFSALAVFIACLGLWALAMYSGVTRRKEIGVRKVNGASAGSIMSMLNADILKWVISAFIIGARYLMHKWLENFAWKTALSWWIFASAALFTLVIAVAAVSWQSYKAANRNPVEVLKDE